MRFFKKKSIIWPLSAGFWQCSPGQVSFLLLIALLCIKEEVMYILLCWKCVSKKRSTEAQKTCKARCMPQDYRTDVNSLKMHRVLMVRQMEKSVLKLRFCHHLLPLISIQEKLRRLLVALFHALTMGLRLKIGC